jgi:L-threonylcarbamoyladenylate synthase
MIYHKSDNNSVEKVANLLRAGKIVIIPTDTVYGFSGIAEPDKKNRFHTDELIRRIKGRSETKPFIRLIATPDDIRNYTSDVIPETLLNKWPGALTIIVHDQYGATTAFRCPGDAWIRSVIAACGYPIYSTSVNRSGASILETVADIRNEFEEEVSMFVADGDKTGAKPSTIVKLDKGNICVLRQGSVIV